MSLASAAVAKRPSAMEGRSSDANGIDTRQTSITPRAMTVVPTLGNGARPCGGSGGSAKNGCYWTAASTRTAAAQQQGQQQATTETETPPFAFASTAARVWENAFLIEFRSLTSSCSLGAMTLGSRFKAIKSALVSLAAAGVSAAAVPGDTARARALTFVS